MRHGRDIHRAGTTHSPSATRRGLLAACACWLVASAQAQVTTPGFLNLPRPEAPGTLLSAPATNDSLALGRTTTLNYLNGWLIVGGEAPGSAPGSDLRKRVYDISDPTAPIRRHPSDFGLTYPHGDYWIQNTDGWNAHGSAQSGPYLLPLVMRVQTFGGPVELGGEGGIPGLSEMALLYNRSSQAGPWDATMLWYGTPAQQMEIRRPRLQPNGIVNAPGDLLATFDHVGPFGGGDWHPQFFGDLLIYARSGAAARDGVVVYRLSYHQFEDADPLNDTVTPQYVGSLQGGFEGYWPNLFSDGSGLYMIGSATDILTAADLTAAADPAGNGQVVQGPTLTIPGFSNASYPVYQDHYAFIHNRKINMTHFLGGQGAGAIVLTLDEAGSGVDTTQMSLPLGNLWITGGYPNGTLDQGMAVWTHQQEPDTTAPAVSYHIPQANRTAYPRFAPLSFLLHEHPRHGGLRNGIDFSVRPLGVDSNTLGAAVAGYLIHDFSGVLTFTPDGGLAADTTYQVDFFADGTDPLNPIGFVDAAGNLIEPYHFRFSTGGGLAANSPPSITTLTPSTYHPEPGEPFTVTAAATPGTAGGPLEYRFNFDEGWSAWSGTASASNTYATTGRKRVLVQARDAGGTPVTQPLNLLVLTPPNGPAPTHSSSLAVGDDPAGRRVWCVNPDANTVTVLDALTGAKLAEHAVAADPRSIARDAHGRYWITCHDADAIQILNPDGSLHTSITLPYGSAPFGVAASPDGLAIFVTLFGSGQLHRYQADTPAAPAMRATFPTPRALAVSGDGERVLVTRFISPELEAEVAEFAGTSPTLEWTRTFRLASANTTDNGDRAAGVPNYLAGICISPDGTRAAIVSKQDNILRGLAFGVPDLTFETTVRAVISFLDLTSNTEIRHARRDFDNADSPSAVTYTPLGDTLLVTLQGNNRVVGLDALNLAPLNGIAATGATLTSPVIKTLEAATGRAPQGLLVDPVTRHLFTQNFMSRNVTVLDSSPLLSENRTSLTTLATTAAVSTELLTASVLQGKRVFYNAADARMSADAYISCASCHLDGGHDGRTWDFTGRGEGLRRTTDLRGRGGMAHGNVHWSANFDELQDFEHDIRGPFGGNGFIPLSPSTFAAEHPSPATVKAGLSADLDALAAYVSSLGADALPRSPHRASDGGFTAAALRGREVFAAQDCTACHRGAQFTDSALTNVNTPLLHALGTTSGLSGQRLGATLPGLDTPTLAGLHASRTFLHHGLAPALADVFAYAGGTLHLAADATVLGNGAEVVVEADEPAQGGGGFLRGLIGGALVSVGGGEGNGIRFSNIDGGTGGLARVAIRHILRGNGSTRLRVNGMEQAISLLPQQPDNAWMTSGWRWVTVAVTLTGGTSNTIDLLRSADTYADFQCNVIVVANADTLAAAAPHHRVMALSTGDRDDLLAYLRQLDGSPGEAPVPLSPDNPDVTLSLAPGFGPVLTDPFVDYDVLFSSPVTGLEAADFIVGGSAGANLRTLTTQTLDSNYRLRLTSFTQPGTLTLQLPAGVAHGLATGSVNNASAQIEITYAPPVTDDLAPLSDEFDDAATLANWLRNNTVEGWHADKLEHWSINTHTAGHMRLMPYSSSWYQDFTGAFAYKEITGDFVLTTRLRVTNRPGSGRPQSDFSLAGLMVRAARGMTQAAPQPDPGPATVLPWPPPANGQPTHYVTDWQPGTENYIFLSFGFGSSGLTTPDGANTNRWHYEIKTTVDGVSTLYPRTHGVPEHEEEATLQIVRRGSTFLLLRRHGAGPWIVENRFSRPDFPATLQVGLTTYTDWNTISAGWDFSSVVEPYHQNRIVNAGVGTPDLIADVAYVRFRRPAPGVDEADLLAVNVTGPNGPVRTLDATALAPWLGDAAAAPLAPPGFTYRQWLGRHLTPSQLADPLQTDTAADLDDDTLPNVIEFLIDGDPAEGLPTERPRLDLTPDGDEGLQPRYRLSRNAAARGWRLSIESSTNLMHWGEVTAVVDGAAPTGNGLRGETTNLPPVMVIGPADSPDPAPSRYYRPVARPLPED